MERDANSNKISFACSNPIFIALKNTYSQFQQGFLTKKKIIKKIKKNKKNKKIKNKSKIH